MCQHILFFPQFALPLLRNYTRTMGKTILITGGQRSGKSEHAERLALQMSDSPVYLATSRIWDDEFRERVRRHQSRRGPQWTNIEEEKWLSRCIVAGRVVVVDCLTLWSTNFLTDAMGDGSEHLTAVERRAMTDKVLREMKAEFERFTSQDATFIVVTNEVGSGGVSANALQRQFTDVQGWINQFVAERADEVILMVSGIACKING